jgi:hypothetical protein
VDNLLIPNAERVIFVRMGNFYGGKILPLFALNFGRKSEEKSREN